MHMYFSICNQFSANCNICSTTLGFYSVLLHSDTHTCTQTVAIVCMCERVYTQAADCTMQWHMFHIIYCALTGTLLSLTNSLSLRPALFSLLRWWSASKSWAYVTCIVVVLTIFKLLCTLQT